MVYGDTCGPPSILSLAHTSDLSKVRAVVPWRLGHGLLGVGKREFLNVMQRGRVLAVAGGGGSSKKTRRLHYASTKLCIGFGIGIAERFIVSD